MNLVLYSLLLAELFVVSFIDIRTKKISNLWSLAHIGIFAGLQIYAGELPELTHFIFPLGMIVVGFILFLFHIMGAGDSKYLASIFLLIPTPLHMPFMEKLLTVTIFVGTILIVMKFVKSAAKIKAYLVTFYFKALKAEIHSRFSYAPVILVAWILFGATLWQ
ncbi:MAG: prepilin peptidase [Bdellovibrionota bacterium]